MFITGPNAPTKHNKTKLAIINCITKGMINAKEIKWAMKHEEECDFDSQAPKAKDNNGNPIGMDTSTVEGWHLKLEMKQCSKNEQANPQIQQD